jgi:hypothetical protein
VDLTSAEAVLLLAPLVAAGQTVLFELAQGTHAPVRGRKSASNFSAGSALTAPPAPVLPDTHPQPAEGHACRQCALSADDYAPPTHLMDAA